jgi:HB1, ASXL, restriction endonuclease HTH domain
VTSWAPTTVVEPVGFEPHFQEEENDVSKKTKTRKEAPTTTKARNAKAKAVEKTLVNDPALGLVTKELKAEGKLKAAKAAKMNAKLSCIDAAARVLAEAKEPMTTKAMIEQMAAKELWSSPNGQTPAATLYSAILREINTKGKESRFKKADRGLFTKNG